MFIFLSQRNKKCTSLPVLGVEVCLPGGTRRPWTPKPYLGMLYLAYQLQSDIMTPVRAWAGMAANAGGPPLLNGHAAMRNLTAVYELISAPA